MNKTFGNHANISNFLTLMFKGPQSLADIARETGMAYETVRHLVLHLHKSGCLHITGWRRDMRNRSSIALYQIGIGVDVPKPRARTGVERTRKYLDKLDKPLISDVRKRGVSAKSGSDEIMNVFATWAKS